MFPLQQDAVHVQLHAVSMLGVQLLDSLPWVVETHVEVLLRQLVAAVCV